jgi:hypothetical protein
MARDRSRTPSLPLPRWILKLSTLNVDAFASFQAAPAASSTPSPALFDTGQLIAPSDNTASNSTNTATDFFSIKNKTRQHEKLGMIPDCSLAMDISRRLAYITLV